MKLKAALGGANVAVAVIVPMRHEKTAITAVQPPNSLGQ